MKVRYKGGPAAREIPLPGGGWQTVKRGEGTEVPDEVGERLIEQSIWSEVKPARKKKPATKKRAPKRAAVPPAEEQPAVEAPAAETEGEA